MFITRPPTSRRPIEFAVITCLASHFIYRSHPVTCRAAKPFLPCQADEKLKITVQTPITLHTARCLACSGDIETIRQLNLQRIQLLRLAELFAADCHRIPADCDRTAMAMQSVVEMNLAAATARILRHLCLCRKCRNRFCEKRRAMLTNLPPDNLSQIFPCPSVSPADIFVYAVPYGHNPARDEYAVFRPSLTSHLSKCPACLGKLLKLHNTLFGILERPDSGIVTRFAPAELN